MDDLLKPVPDAVLIGRLRREFILPASDPPVLNEPGGNLAYAAAAFLQWGGKPGVVSRINNDYPSEWLEYMSAIGMDTDGIHVSSESFDDRFFVTYNQAQKPIFENPISHFADRQLGFPQQLLNYKPTEPVYCSKTDYSADSIHITDIPPHYLEASAAHISPIDYISHSILPSVLKGGMILTLTMRAASCYMDPIFWENIRALVSDVTVLMFTEAQGLKLFQGRSADLWEIAGVLASYGPEFIIIHAIDGTVMVYSRIAQKRWILPAYPAKVSDPTGMLDTFDGAFLQSYRKDYDVVRAALSGIVSSSFCVEGSGPYYILGCMPGLKEARLKVLANRVMEL
ncbi:MAG: carbohydrate kinase family protein [Chloroflexi bacterium]|nr:carbohydrate kinase family protein [Chloroflexota bacterium]